MKNKNEMPRRPCGDDHKEIKITFDFEMSKMFTTESVPPVTMKLSVSSIAKH